VTVDITVLLHEWKSGDAAALSRVTDLVYQDLRRLASHYLRKERPDHTLDATELVHEVYLRMQGLQHVDWQTRADFLSMVARLMRNILVDHARRRSAIKRRAPEECDFPEVVASNEIDVIAVHEALERMASEYPRAAQVVELRFFGGLEAAEAAEVLRVSLSSVERDWRFAKAWLRDAITESR
jgi:RNA polymerase sigma-70 factor, ECF subfamily